jgi:hypothetical protein
MIYLLKILLNFFKFFLKIKIILEIDLTGTSIYHELFDTDFKNIYMTNNVII